MDGLKTQGEELCVIKDYFDTLVENALSSI